MQGMRPGYGVDAQICDGPIKKKMLCGTELEHLVAHS